MASENKPTRAQLNKMISNQGVWLVLLSCCLFALTWTLARKGVISWDDLVNEATDG